MNEDLVQFKLANGEEILCRVMDWDVDDQFASILVRYAFKLLTVEDPNVGMRYYTLRPWMTYMDDPDKQMLLSSMMIVGQSKPSGKLLDQYCQTVQSYLEPENEEDKNIEDVVNEFKSRVKSMYDSSYESIPEGFPIH